MTDKLAKTFLAYTNAVHQSNLQRQSEERAAKGSLRPFVNSAVALPAMVDQLEMGAEFHQLVTETRSSFSGDYHEESKWAWWQQAAKNFFRRSGYYTDIFDAKNPDFDAALIIINGFRIISGSTV